jgi:hypothetical protein
VSYAEVMPTDIKVALYLDSAEERDVLLAALDFARSYLRDLDYRDSVSQRWTQPAGWYQQRMDPIEQVLADTRGER